MRLIYALFWLLICTYSVLGQQGNPNIAATPPLTPEEQLKKFHLPPGFVVELVAAEPKINKPINIAFDALGRLWVTESVEYPYPAPMDRPGKDKVKILSGFGQNGLASSVSTFAGGLNIPIGVLPGLDGHTRWSTASPAFTGLPLRRRAAWPTPVRPSMAPSASKTRMA